MKRLFISLLLLSAGAVVALPGAVGLVAERQHNQIVGQINAHGDQLTEERYERGWFSTSTRYRYRIEDKQLRNLVARITKEPEGVPELLVDSQIYHGPIPMLGGGVGRAALAWTDMDSTLSLRSPSGIEIPLPGELHSQMEPDGSSRFRYHAEAESRSLRDGMTFAWQETDVDVLLGRDMNTMSVDGDIGLLRLFDAEAALQVGPAAIKTRQQRSRNGLWSGDTTIQIDGVSLPGFALDDLLLEARALESSGQATYAIELKAKNLTGNGFAGNDAHVDFFAERLDAPALGNLLQLIAEYSGQRKIPVARRDELLSQLLVVGPEVTLRTLKIPMSGADIEGEGFVSIDPGTGIGLGDISRGAKGNATLLVPQNLVNKFKAGTTPEMQQVIALMMRLRVLKPEGNRYRLEAKYGTGLLTVNGFPIPIPNL